jgi:hypothetical protein
MPRILVGHSRRPGPQRPARRGLERARKLRRIPTSPNLRILARSAERGSKSTQPGLATFSHTTAYKVSVSLAGSVKCVLRVRKFPLTSKSRIWSVPRPGFIPGNIDVVDDLAGLY